MVINKGYLDGIRLDQAVVANQNGVPGLVGKITKVSLNSAVVQPVHHQDGSGGQGAGAGQEAGNITLSVFPPAPVANGVGVCANGVLQNTRGERNI